MSKKQSIITTMCDAIEIAIYQFLDDGGDDQVAREILLDIIKEIPNDYIPEKTPNRD